MFKWEKRVLAIVLSLWSQLSTLCWVSFSRVSLRWLSWLLRLWTKWCSPIVAMFSCVCTVREQSESRSDPVQCQPLPRLETNKNNIYKWVFDLLLLSGNSCKVALTVAVFRSGRFFRLFLRISKSGYPESWKPDEKPKTCSQCYKTFYGRK